jgi:hypothetical protein
VTRFFGGAAVEVEAVRRVVDRRLAKRLNSGVLFIIPESFVV